MHSRGYFFLVAAAIVLTSIENGTEPQSQFFCTGRIHGYIRLPKRQEGKHVLEGSWILPNGKVLHQSRDWVNFDPPGRSTAYVWFSFPDHSTLSLNPQADEERLSYNGVWTVKVRWDEKPLLQSTFSVTCQ